MKNPNQSAVRCWICLATCLVLSTPIHANDSNEPTLTVSPSKIHLGEVAKLKWMAAGSAAFLSGFGTVPTSGSLAVSPRESTDFTLLIDDNGRIKSRKVRVELDDARGDSIGPDLDRFSGGVTGQEAVLGFVQFQDFVFKTLQNRMEFRPVRGDFAPDRPYDVLYTELKESADLVQPNDVGIRRRRIAYSVTIDRPDDDARPPRRFEVKALIEYQLLGESRWHPEDKNSPLIGRESAALERLLEAPSTSSE